MKKKDDGFNRGWIIENALDEIKNYEKGMLTLRGLHYRLVARGMTNTIQHYKRVVAAMTHARWNGDVDFDTFSDHDREMLGSTAYQETDVDTEIQSAKDSIEYWMDVYNKNRWENQEHYIEVMIEKKALIGVFERPCRRQRVTMGACKGYPSLTFLNEAKYRILEAIEAGKKPIILYFGDYDPSGEDIPRSIGDNLERLGCHGIEVRRIALMEDQVVKWELPPAPAKSTDTRTAKWSGLGQVELDAVEPKQLQEMVTDAIRELFDEDRHSELMVQEEQERQQYRKELKSFVNSL